MFSDIRNWIRNIEQHASDNVNKILVGNKADMDESKRVSLRLKFIIKRHQFFFRMLSVIIGQVCFILHVGCLLISQLSLPYRFLLE